MAFGPKEGDLYFGREEVISSILDRLLERGLMAVVGASGSGKSSLVRAGLVWAFRRVRNAPAVVMTPGSDPSAELKRSLSRQPARIADRRSAGGDFHALSGRGEPRPLFRCPHGPAGDGSTALVVALRADFYGRCADYPRLAAAVAEHQHLLGPMRTDELRRAIESPARVAGLRLEAGLLDAMLADVDGEPGALPLLSHALMESWARRDGRVLTLAGYREAGGVRGAITRTAEELFENATESEQRLLRRMFLRLTEPGEGTEDTRRRVPLGELAAEGERRCGGDLLREAGAPAPGGGRRPAVRPRSAHPRVAEAPRVAERGPGELRAHRHLTRGTGMGGTGRDDAELYRGARLAAALDWGDGRSTSRDERDFLEASRTRRSAS